MKNKYTQIFFLFGVIFLIVFFFSNKAEKAKNGLRENKVATHAEVNKVNNKSNSKGSILNKKSPKKIVLSQKKQVGESRSPEISLLMSHILEDHEICESSMNEILGSEDSQINLNLFTEFEVMAMIDKFNEINFTSSKMKELLEKISSDDFSFTDEKMNELSNLKPCRMFQKINFLDEIKKVLLTSDNADFKDGVENKLSIFFEKEVRQSSSIANLTMVLNMVEAFVADSDSNEYKKFSSDLEQLIDDIESDYEKMLISAENDLDEDGDVDNFQVSKKFIKKELILSEKYKLKVSRLIKERPIK